MSVISIIIPVYNCENYLSKCLDSVINQTYKDIEIICINDGSTDKSLSVLDEYAKKDSRITIISQDNAKQGAARNKGLDIAKGDYIIFLDSDDWIDLNYCEEMLNAVNKNNADLAISISTRDYTNKVKKHVDIKEFELIRDINVLLPKINFDLRVTGKMYKTSILSDLRFLEYAFYEDAPYAIRALHNSQSTILVPNTTYHYFSNPTSTIKTKQTEPKRNDIIETQLDLIKYAKDNNITIRDNLVARDENLIFKVKTYTDRKEYYFCGIKYYTKHVEYKDEKIFVAVLMACFGDVILCNSLFQNIKKMYPNSKTIFIVDKPWEEAAKYQKDVDEVYVFDKRGKNRGVFGLLKFILNFPYKNIDYVFKIYDNFRTDIIASLLIPRLIIGKPYNPDLTVQERHCYLLKKITHKKIQNYPIVYNADSKLTDKFKDIITNDKKYIAICPCSSRIEKNMPLKTAINLISKFNNKNYEVVITGAGNTAKKYAEELINNGCKFINLVNKTTIYELAKVLRNCKALISVDTGTMHFGYANNIPTLCVFYEQENIMYWAPFKTLYPQTQIISQNITSEEIYNELKELIE